ncbi:hypothetical protein TNCV_262541 [Trichonephila clavipes]|nr:hypothetical protein TNCV_262541 [Trichonephila clavipes]
MRHSLVLQLTAATCRNIVPMSGDERKGISQAFRRDSLPKTQNYTPADNVRDEFHHQNPVSMNTIRRELDAVNIHVRVAIPKTLAYAWNAMKSLK